MTRRWMLTMLLLASSALFCANAGVAGASVPFGLSEFDATYTNGDGSTDFQAGSHPFALTTTLRFNSEPNGVGGEVSTEQPKDILVSQVPGLVGDLTAVPRCPNAAFLTEVEAGGLGGSLKPDCPDATAVGIARTRLSGAEVEASGDLYSAIYNLEPPPGVPERLGFWVSNVPVQVQLSLSESPPYNVVGGSTNISQLLEVLTTSLTVWGVPTSEAHDSLRGGCLSGSGASLGSCPVGAGAQRPFLTVPRSCQGPLATSYMADSWQRPGAKLPDGRPDLADPNWLSGSVLTHDQAEPPQPHGFSLCGKLGFNPSITAQPTAKAASSPTGLDFSLNVNNEGLTNPSPEALADSDIEKAVITLPEGMSANPSLAEGLNVCTEEELERETAFSEAGEGCPSASKIGTVEVETPLLEETVKGSLYIAKPYENPFSSLLAMYIVLQNEKLGISVKQPLKVVPDPVTGQLTTIAEELPQLPFSHFRLHFREGARSPLATPQACGAYDVHAMLYPYSGQPPLATTSAFEIISGPDNAPCPKGGLPPFHPGLLAGTINNRAASFSPFYTRIYRSDSEQEITHFSIKLPPGVVGKLAGIPFCPDAAIQQAKERTGPHGGQEELNSPSCPAASEIGHTLAGAGVGPALAYAPGKVYLGGPYHGAPMSIVAITAGVVGPFDIGTVVVREALRVNPETGEVFIDATGSDPIPHIIRGIPVHLRDIRVYVDRPEFVLNPTSCEPTSTASTVLGSGLDFVSEADDNPVTVTSPFQAADCAALRFKPQLGLRLKGGTHRGAHPAFHAHLEMTGIGEAGIAQAQVALPRSEFIENAHFRTICTRVQFNEGAGNGADCPPGSIYGSARAVTPILSEPLEGPVFLRSNGGERNLPDLVVALHNSQVDFDLVGFVDSVKGGGIRNTFAAAPDAPVSSFDLYMAGGSKGLFVNSTNLCKKTHRAKVVFIGQNGKVYESKPALKAKCPKAKKHRKRHRAHRRVQLRYMREVGR